MAATNGTAISYDLTDAQGGILPTFSIIQGEQNYGLSGNKCYSEGEHRERKVYTDEFQDRYSGMAKRKSYSMNKKSDVFDILKQLIHPSTQGKEREKPFHKILYVWIGCCALSAFAVLLSGSAGITAYIYYVVIYSGGIIVAVFFILRLKNIMKQFKN